jgi:C4-dicarboxylate transporter DctM subunit
MVQWLLLIGVVLFGALAFRKKPVPLGIWMAITLAVFFLTKSTTFLLVGALLLSLVLGLPLFVLIGFIVLICFVYLTDGYGDSEALTVIIRKTLELASKEVLLAIPFFVVSGEIMTQGSLAKRLIDVAKACFGWVPGGLAVAAVFGCVFFAAISGSSPVTVIAIGSIMVPALVKSSYPEKFSMGLLTSAGSLGILIPPSIPMIVYAIMVSAATPVDPTDLFLAGVVPGLVIGSLLGAYAIYTGIKYKLPTEPFSVAHVWSEMKRGFWSLLLPIIILGGIYSGIFTPTEAAAVAVVYSLVVEIFIHQDLKLPQLVTVGERSMIMMGSLLLIMALAVALNYFLVIEMIPDRMVEWIQSLDLSRVSFLLIVNVFLLLVGTVMDIMSAIMILAPMLAPMSVAMDIHPLHMGIIFIVNLEIGYLTPPVGLNLFVASTLFQRSLGEIIKSVLPPLGLMLVGLLLVTWVEAFSLGLVGMINPSAVADWHKEEVPVEQPVEQPGKVKSLQELMKEQKGGGGSGSGKVKSLQELMQDAKNKKQGGDASGEAPRVKSLQELMKDAKQDAPPAPPPNQKPRVKSLQELMKEANDKEGAP